MKTFSRSLTYRLLRLLVLVFAPGIFAAPAARAGLTMQLGLTRGNYQGDQFYSFGCYLQTNSTPPNVSFGDYLVVSPGWPANANACANLFHFDTNGFNQVSSIYNSFSQFDSTNFSDSFIQNITNGQWTIFVTNAVTTNVYHFTVTANIGSNSIPLVSIIYPPNNALNVTNQPTFVWQSSTNYSDQILYVPNSGYDLPVTQQSFSGTTLDAGLSSVTVDTYYLSSTGVAGSVPTNSAGSPLSGWVSTWQVWDYANVQFTVGSPVADFNSDLGTTNFPWATLGDAAWFTETTNTYNGAPAADQSGSVTGGQASILSVTVNGPGTLTFSWSSMAEDPNQGFNYEFDIDGNYGDNITGDTAWYQEVDWRTGLPYVIPAGQHTLTWTVSAGGDTDPTEAGFLDNVSYVAAASPTLTVTASPTNGQAPLAVQFTSPSVDSLGNTITNWSWTFGDGGTSTAQSPSYTYTTAGSFSPSLAAYSTFGTTPLSVTGPGAIILTPPLPSPGMWTLTGSLTNALSLHTATLLPNGKVLVVGGSDNSYNATAAAQLYDPATGTWTGTNAMGKARYAHTATLLPNGEVLVAGGTTNQYDSTGASLVQTVEMFNPTNSTWTTTGALNSPRFFHTATLLANGMVLVTGGMNADTYPATILNSSELYDPATGLWTTTGPLQEARYNHTATLLANGMVLVTGGQVTNFFLVTASAELYDPVAGTWTATGSMPYPLANHTATWLPNGQVLVAGGDIDIGSYGGYGLYPVPFAELYDPVTGLWTPTTAMHFNHDYHTATLLTNGIVLIAGGGAQFGSSTNCAELYEPVSQTWTAAATMNTPRKYHTATLLPNGLVLAAGGSDNSGLLASAELYNSIAATLIRIINPTRLPGGAFQFGFTNTPGAGFTALSTTNLSLSSSNWSVIGSIPEISPGVFQFIDQQATNSPQHFYRVRFP
jgi:PKD repeat protein